MFLTKKNFVNETVPMTLEFEGDPPVCQGVGSLGLAPC